MQQLFEESSSLGVMTLPENDLRQAELRVVRFGRLTQDLSIEPFGNCKLFFPGELLRPMEGVSWCLRNRDGIERESRNYRPPTLRACPVHIPVIIEHRFSAL